MHPLNVVKRHLLIFDLFILYMWHFSKLYKKKKKKNNELQQSRIISAETNNSLRKVDLSPRFEK